MNANANIAMRPYEDTLVTMRGPGISQLADAGGERRMDPHAQGAVDFYAVLCPMGVGPIARFYWAFVALFFGAVLYSLPGIQGLAVGASAAAMIGAGVWFGPSIEAFAGKVWPVLKWALILAVGVGFLYPFVKDISEGKFPSLIAPAHAQQTGIASMYTTKTGTKTASGRRLNDGALTAAHRSLPFGTRVRVTHLRNGRSVIVTITDRGPFIRGRIIDLTAAGAAAIGMGFSIAPVRVDRL